MCILLKRAGWRLIFLRVAGGEEIEVSQSSDDDDEDDDDKMIII